MDEILKNAWIQGGATGLLAISGWVLAYLVNQERKYVQARRDMLLEQILTFMNEEKDLLEKLTDRLDFQETLRKEIENLREKR